MITQGLGQLKVDLARAAFGTRGAGETIAVISDSFNRVQTQAGAPVTIHAHEDELSNDLPGPASTCSGQQVPVNVLEDAAANEPASNTDEGRAMLGVVHDLAPHAKLAFATGSPTELTYAKNIERLAAPVSAGGAGADVIVDDLSYPTEPFFQDSLVAGGDQAGDRKGGPLLQRRGERKPASTPRAKKSPPGKRRNSAPRPPATRKSSKPSTTGWPKKAKGPTNRNAWTSTRAAGSTPNSGSRSSPDGRRSSTCSGPNRATG